MNKVELKEFRKLRKTLEKKSLRENKELLHRVGIYYQVTIPSEIDQEYAKQTERFLNDLYIKATKEYSSNDVQKNLSRTLGIASSISYAIKTKNFSPETFSWVKDLGEALISISYSI